VTAWLDRVMDPDGPPFALLVRPESGGPDTVDLLVGSVSEVDRLGDVPLPAGKGRDRHEVLALLPYCQIRERGFDHPPDTTRMLAMSVDDHEELPLDEVLAALPTGRIQVADEGFDLDDDQYGAMVRRVLAEEIGDGKGSNFVVKRAFTARIANWSRRTALTFYRRVLRSSSGSYWTFVIHTGHRTFVGASPERHLSVNRGTVVMNPISGTYRYPPTGPDLTGLLRFLANAKEVGELYMVLDEELKMMSQVCERGARVLGPYLKQLAKVAHTEYLIEGRSSMDVREMLRHTMFAPTVIGGPLESACRTIARHEPEGRGFYGGVAVLIGRDADGGRALDSAILIRTADVDRDGLMRIGVGATVVRDSEPAGEAAETWAKAGGLLAALRDGEPEPGPGARVNLDVPAVRATLAERNSQLADFWFEDPLTRRRSRPDLAGRRVLVIDAEDMFTAMSRNLLMALGLDVTTVRYDEPYEPAGYDMVLVGPGPGNPCETTDPKIAHLYGLVRGLLAAGIPFLAVCLGHQVVSRVLGLEVRRHVQPNQGVQRKIDLFGRGELVGCYNTFSAYSPDSQIPCPGRDGVVEVFRAEADDEVYALRGPGFAAVQCHLESVLSENGVDILGDVLAELLADSRALPAV
jgi:phenazine biosynthesis protein phzE